MTERGDAAPMELPPMIVACPCGTEVEVPIAATLAFGEDNRQHLEFDPDLSDLWAHSWSHDADEQRH